MNIQDLSERNYDRSCEGLSELLGKVCTEIVLIKAADHEFKYEDMIYFITSGGEIYKMFHYNDCCESVTIEDIVGDLEDLIGDPIVEAEHVTNKTSGYNSSQNKSETWSFYKFGTRKASVTVRWYGTSNGCYGETADFYKLLPYIEETK